MPSRVRVVARVRPTGDNTSETSPVKLPPQYSLSSPTSPISSVPSSRALSIDPINSKLVSYRPFASPLTFEFDRVLPPGASQGAVFDAAVNVANISEDVFKGLSGGVLCYGQTGAGKTFTMFGDMGDDIALEETQLLPPPPPLSTNLTAAEMLATPTRVHKERKEREEEEKRMALAAVARHLALARKVQSDSNIKHNINEFNLPPKSTPSQRINAIKSHYKPKNSNVINSSKPQNLRQPPPPPPTACALKPKARHLVTKPPEGAGIIPRVVRALFGLSRRYEKKGDDVKITFCFVQLYNEKVSDLLRPPNPSPKPSAATSLAIREDPNLGVFIPDATQVIATSTKGVLAVLRTAAKHRAVRETNQNSASSRSHAILRFTVTRGTEDAAKPGMSKVRRGTLTFVDLAGSERIVKSGIDKNKPAVNEAKQINKSISALGNVIKALAKNSSTSISDPSSEHQHSNLSHIPFRDSKLTRILTETLSGKAACVLIANLSNQIDNAEENMMTLKFAERAMSIATKPIKFESVVKMQPKRAKKERGRGQVYMAETEKTNNQVLLDQYKSAKRVALQKRNGNIQFSQGPPPPPPPSSSRPIIPPHHNNFHLMERNNQLEAENETLRRLLAAQNASKNKVIEPVIDEEVDLLQLDTLDSEAAAPTSKLSDPFSCTVNNLVPPEEFSSSLHNRANNLALDVEKMKQDLMEIIAGGDDENDVFDGNGDEKNEDADGANNVNGSLNSSLPSTPSSVDDFFAPPPTSWESERATLKKTIDELQRTVAMKNVKIAQLENQIQNGGKGLKSVRFQGGQENLKVVRRRKERGVLTNKTNHVN